MKTYLKSLALIGLALSALVACQESASQSTSSAGEVMSSPEVTLGEIATPDLNFSKSDQTSSARLRSETILGEARQGEGVASEVIPLQLQRGDQLLISAWSDEPSALMIFQPSAERDVWRDEARRALTQEAEVGVNAIELNLSATKTGAHALVIKPLRERARYIIVATCVSGPCLDAADAARQEAIQEEREATSRAVPPSAN